MINYAVPTNEIPLYSCKFIRVKDKIYVTSPNDIDTLHHTLAETDGINDELFKLIRSNPNDVDAGQITVLNNESRKRVRVSMSSIGYGIPLTDQARVNTAEIIGRLTPGYEIRTEMPFRSKER